MRIWNRCSSGRDRRRRSPAGRSVEDRRRVRDAADQARRDGEGERQPAERPRHVPPRPPAAAAMPRAITSVMRASLATATAGVPRLTNSPWTIGFASAEILARATIAWNVAKSNPCAAKRVRNAVAPHQSMAQSSSPHHTRPHRHAVDTTEAVHADNENGLGRAVEARRGGSAPEATPACGPLSGPLADVRA